MDFMAEVYTVFVGGASWSCRTAGLQARFMIHERAWRPAVRQDHEPHCQIGLPALDGQRVISALLGSALSATLRAVSTPATGRPLESSRPTCTSTEAWSQ